MASESGTGRPSVQRPASAATAAIASRSGVVKRAGQYWPRFARDGEPMMRELARIGAGVLRAISDSKSI